MKQYEVELPLRKISVVIEMEASLTPFEDEALSKYTALHNFVFELIESYKSWKARGENCRTQLQQRRDELIAFEKQMEVYNHFVRIITAQEELPENETVDIKINPGQLTIDANKFADDFKKLYEDLKAWVDEFENLENAYEKYHDLFEDFDNNYYNYIWQNYESVNIDLCTIDDDYNNFKETLSPIEDLRNTSIDERDDLLKEYDPLVKRVNIFYREVEHFFEVFKKIENMNGSANEDAQWN